MSSITTWTRLEPRNRSAEMSTTLQAQIQDPLWLLFRQWQLEEFKGEDAGMPVVARLRAECSRLTHYLPEMPRSDSAGKALLYDGRETPLETLVEHEHIERGRYKNMHACVEAGLHFGRLLDKHKMGAYKDKYLIPAYTLKEASSADREKLDGDSLRFLDVMAGRALDGSALYDAFKASLHPPSGGPSSLPAEPQIPLSDVPTIKAVAEEWLSWYESIFSEPDADKSAWVPERMEYEFAVAAPKEDRDIVLTAHEYVGDLDWYSFDVEPNASLGSSAYDAAQRAQGRKSAIKHITRTIIPTYASYRGMPAPRWWEFEDRQIDFGAVEAAPEDLARMLLTEFALIYSNDFFIIPINLEVGSVCRIRSLVVTDSFGERLLIRPSSEVDGFNAPWQMFHLSGDKLNYMAKQKLSNIFFLPPVLGPNLQSPPLEEVMFVRDEMANMAWAIERIVEGPLGRPLNRFEAFQEKRRRLEEQTTPTTPTSSRIAPIAYRLATSVPDYWIPLLPVQNGYRRIKLQVAAMPDEDPTKPIEFQGNILKANGMPLELYEEEVPRAGALVARIYQYTRWIDGSTHLWIGRQKRTGKGEGSSGLRFDIIEEVSD